MTRRHDLGQTLTKPVTKRNLNREEAAEFLGLAVSTLATWATRGGGPKFLRLGRAVRYRVSDLEEFERQREQSDDVQE